MEPEEEHVLVERARDDPLAFGALYELYVDRVYNYVYQRTGNRFDAEDLTARTFLKAFAHLEQYVFRGIPFSAWLYRIAHNAVANWYRDRRRHVVVSLDALVARGDDCSGPEDETQAREERRNLLRAIHQLPSNRQQLLILKFSEGLKNAQIAEITDSTEGAIKSLYHRTLIALRRELERNRKG